MESSRPEGAQSKMTTFDPLRVQNSQSPQVPNQSKDCDFEKLGIYTHRVTRTFDIIEV
jgi:hypothetical protein